MLTTYKTWILMCAFRNEGRTLLHFLDELHQVLSQARRLSRSALVLVDDFSLDDSADIVLKWKDQHPELEVHLLSPPTNLGNQGALAWALSSLVVSSEQWIFTMDADGEDDLTQIPSMMREAEVHEGHVVYSLRQSRRDGLRMSLLYHPFRALYQHMSGRKILPNNFMVLPGRFHRGAVHSPFLPAYYSLSILRLGLPHRCLYANRRERYGGRSTQNIYNLITHALVGLMIFHETVIAKVYTYITLACCLFLGTNLFALFVKFLQDKPVPDGYASLYLTMNFGFLVSLFAMLGFTAAISITLKLVQFYSTRWNAGFQEDIHS